jgi:phosphatidylserine/phosphatidylglycerophosphate/cardiolipin synthase-like enzyme
MVPARLAVALALAALGCGLPGPGARRQGTAPGAIDQRIEPEDGAQVVPELIMTATRSLALEIYLLTDRPIIASLASARQNGLAVSVILEANPFGAAGANQAAFDQLTSAGVDVRWASARFALTHTKLLLVDGWRAAIMTSNLTRAGLTTNREYILVDDDPSDLADLQRLVAADRVGAPTQGRQSRIVTSPETSRPALLALLASARSRLDVEMEELSDAQMTAALEAAVGRGVAVTVVAPASDASTATRAALARLDGAGATVRLLDAPVIHAKTIVADGLRLYVGSINLTAASLDRNREVGLIVDDPQAAQRVTRTVAADAALGAPF